MFGNLWRFGAASVFAFAIGGGTAAAQAPCETATKSDFINFTYSPSRPFSGRNGQFSVLADDIVADDEHSRETISRSFTARRSDEVLTATATIDILDAVADIETWWFPGGGEAGIELNLEARNASGTLICTDREELYIARYFEESHPAGRRVLSCELPTRSAGEAEGITVSVEAHAWVTVFGFTSANASVNAQIVTYSLQGCSGSCSASCGGLSSGGSCWCDEACTGFGDCCADFAPLCAADSCWEQCGGASPAGCWCDDACAGFGDCCADHAESCL